MTPLRLPPGTDLKAGLLALLAQPAWADGAFVVAGIGSLHGARLRLAAADAATEIAGPCELLSLQGTLSTDGAHLHAALADAQGRVWGGHLLDGNRVRTTAELLLAPLPGWRLSRAADAATGYAELVVRPRT
ncbi:DUF296 domain-containing protein [Ideonella sp. 4Y16]|uniref:DUF296 domain-containing protein n=1 Tax=Ideonella alba TaxID=2824118 RepID=A0A940Y9S0_9BURK|nr:DUF296 domain-containing protein [Ideonella alba]MBQ0931483.1 DUF296 domain-containing protein [Ideonella alba]MBQ0943788.1 DUF296 domain-containing protein [Ideonella alba]